MPCTSESILPYLHWNGRQIYNDADFLDLHRIYRIGNPIEFPQGTTTALSCKWGFIINEEDVLIADDPPIGDDYKYAYVESIRQFSTPLKEKTDGDNLGWHKLSCVFEHDPNECDYSHCEINIKHDIFNNEDEGQLISSEVYTYEMWQDESCLLQKRNRFFKDLKNDYKIEMVKLFYLPVEENDDNIGIEQTDLES